MTTSPTLKPCRADAPSHNANTVPESLEDVLPVSPAQVHNEHAPVSSDGGNVSDEDRVGSGSGDDTLAMTCIF